MGTNVLHPTDLHSADLHRSLDDLAAQDLSTLCDAEIHELTMGLAKAKCRVEGVLMAALDVWDSRQIWSDDGSKSPAARLAREANWSKAAASTAIRRARALRRLPVTAAAVTAGKMGAEFVDLVDHASTVDLTVPFSACEPAIVDGCIRSGYAESKDAINRWVDAANPEDAEKRAKKRFERRGLTAAGIVDGLVHLNGLLDAVGGRQAGAHRVVGRDRVEHLRTPLRTCRRHTDDAGRPRPPPPPHRHRAHRVRHARQGHVDLPPTFVPCGGAPTPPVATTLPTGATSPHHATAPRLDPPHPQSW